MFKTILAATDGSDHAVKAVEVASDLAEKYGSSLILLHVVTDAEPREDVRKMLEVEYPTEFARERVAAAGAVPESVTGLVRLGGNSGQARRAAQLLGRSIVERAERAAKDKGVRRVKTLIEEGDVTQRILGCAEREGADLIVMGSRGRSDLKGLLLGSNSHKVSQLAPCTCITVK